MKKEELQGTIYNNKPTLLPVVDFAFKLIFANKEDISILRSFLSAVLEIKENSITDINIDDTVLAKGDIFDRRKVLNAKVTTTSGKMDVEILMSFVKFTAEESLYNWSKIYTQEPVLKNAKPRSKLEKCVTINIVDFNVTDTDKVHTIFNLRESTGYTKLTDVLEIHFLELRKYKSFKGESIDNNANLMNWVRFFNARSREELTTAAEQNDSIKKAVDVLEAAAMNPKTKALYDARIDELRDILTREEERWQEGRERSRELVRVATINILTTLIKKRFNTDDLDSDILELLSKTSLDRTQSLVGSMFEVNSLQDIRELLKR